MVLIFTILPQILEPIGRSFLQVQWEKIRFPRYLALIILHQLISPFIRFHPILVRSKLFISVIFLTTKAPLYLGLQQVRSHIFSILWIYHHFQCNKLEDEKQFSSCPLSASMNGEKPRSFSKYHTKGFLILSLIIASSMRIKSPPIFAIFFSPLFLFRTQTQFLKKTSHLAKKSQKWRW